MSATEFEKRSLSALASLSSVRSAGLSVTRSGSSGTALPAAALGERCEPAKEPGEIEHCH
jgi:hypothetical protein